MTVTLWCFTCDSRLPHRLIGSSAECQECETWRPVEGDLLPAEPHPVADMRFCRWCNETREVGHTCPAGAVRCTEREPEQTPCGGCGFCIAAQTADLVRREHPFTDDPYGSPTDLDTPWSGHE